MTPSQFRILVVGSLSASLLAGCAEPIPQESQADQIPIAPVVGTRAAGQDRNPEAERADDGGRIEPLLSAVTRADGALLGSASVATCSFTSENDRVLFRTAVSDESDATAQGVARIGGEPVMFQAVFAGAPNQMEQGGRFTGDNDLIAELTRNEGEASDEDAAAAMETRDWPATLAVGYDGTTLVTRNRGNWSCDN